MPFVPTGSEAVRDYPNFLAAIDVRHYDEASIAGMADSQEPGLSLRMNWVRDCRRQRVCEYGRSVVEGDSVLLYICVSFVPSHSKTRSKSPPVSAS